MSRFLTVPEVAALLHVPEGTVRFWHRDRQLRGFLAGRRLLFEREDIEGFIARRKAG